MSVSGSPWFDQRVLWIGRPSYRGQVLIRGARVDDAGPMRFGLDEPPPAELQFPSAVPGSRGWRNWPTDDRFPGPGCYAFQADGRDFSVVVVFRVTLAP